MESQTTRALVHTLNALVKVICCSNLIALKHKRGSCCELREAHKDYAERFGTFGQPIDASLDKLCKESIFLGRLTTLQKSFYSAIVLSEAEGKMEEAQASIQKDTGY